MTSAYIRRAGLNRDLKSKSGTTNDQRSASPLSIHSTSKRTTISASSNQRAQSKNPTETQHAEPTQPKSSPTSAHEKLTGESLSEFRKRRAKSSVTTRTLFTSVKAKNERSRQKQQTNLKNALIDPWKVAPWTDTTMEESIPNSIDVMHKMCGPATPFERNLRQNYHRQLNQLRYGVVPH